MKKITFLTLILLGGFLLFNKNLSASHIPGANISYKCVGPNQYEITAFLVHNCRTGSYMGSTFYIYITNDCGIVQNTSPLTSNTTITNYAGYSYLRLDSIAGQSNLNVSQICGQMLNQTYCNGGTTYDGVKATYYKAIVTLPAGCNAWHFKWSSCCRDNTTNLVGQPGNYVETTMNSGTFPCDNSPVINTTPIPYGCAGQTNCYNLNVTDPDGDSLRYALIPAQSGTGAPPNGTPVPYQGGYNGTSPIPGVTIDPNNGTICYNTTAGNYVFAVMIYSYDRTTGQLKGTMIYDFQVIVIACTNQNPQPPAGGLVNITGGTKVNNNTASVCEGSTVCFDLVFSDPDLANQLYASSNVSTVLPGATMTTTGTNPITVRICYSAPIGTTGQSSFVVNVTDSVCPIYANTAYAVNLIIKPIPTITTTNATICAGQNATITANGLAAGGTYSWTPGGQTTPSITVSPAATTTYTVTYTLNGCPATATSTVTVNPLPTVTVNNQTICAGQSATLTATPSAGGGTYLWSPGGATTPSITVSPGATTTYTVTYTLNGCTGTGSGTVTVNPNPTVTVNNQTICAGQSATLTATPSAGGGTYLWAPGGATTPSITVSPGATTTYTVTYTLNGCTGTGSGTVTVNPQPTVAVNNQTICAGQSTTLTATPSVGGGTYSWTPGGATTQTINVTPGATTTYTVTYTLNGCTATGSGTVTISPNPTITVVNDTICAGQTGSLTATPSAGGGTYSWTPGGATTQTMTASPGATTTYTVTYNLGGCIGTGSGTIVVKPQPTITANATPTTICAGQTVNITSTPSTGGGTYSWAPGGQTTQNITVTPATTTTYTVTYDLNGCTNTANTTVTVNPQPTVNVPDVTICAGQTATLTATPSVGGGTYSWTPGGMTTQTINVTPGSTTTYYVTYTLNGCTATDSGTVTINSNPVIQVVNDTICPGQTGSLTAIPNSPGGTYSWTPGGATTQTMTASPGATTTYTVTYNVAGCIGTGSGQIVVKPQPTITANATPATICDGQSTTITSTPSIPGGTYVWTPGGQTTQNITVSPNTTTNYTVTYDLNGCTATGNVTVTVNPVPTVTVNDPTICAGQSANLTATPSIGGGTYAWTPGGQTTQTITVSPGATSSYIVTYTLNGCTATDTGTVTINSNPVIQVTNDTVCPGQPGTITANPNSPGGTYSWTPGGATTQTMTASPGATTTYTVTYNLNGCIGTGSGQIVVKPQPTITANATPATICDGQSTTITSTPSIPGGTYVWTPGGQTTQNITVSPNTTTNYTVTYDLNGCTATGNVTVTVNPQPTVSANDPVICNGGNATMIATPSIGGGIYAWTPGGATTQNVTVSPAATTNYIVTYTLNGCTATDTSTVTVLTQPTVAVNNVTICDGQSATLTATPNPAGGTYSWTPGGQTTQNITVSPNATTNYTVTYDIAGCTATATGTVTVNPQPTVTVNNATICDGETATLTANPSIGGGTYTWTPGGMTTGTVNVNPNTTTTYKVVYTLTGCPDSATATVTVNPLPQPSFTATTVCSGYTSTFTSTSTIGSGSITNTAWNFGDGNTGTGSPVNHQYLIDGTYTVTLVLTSDQGCQDSISQTVTVNPMPQPSFTMNNDCEGLNIPFTNTSTINSGTMTYLWDFGDGNTSTAANPSHAYANCGTYTVKLIATAGTCVDSVSQNITIYCLPTAAFTADTVCLGNQSCFYDGSSVIGSNINQWQWTFGDGGTSAVGNPCHTYATANEIPGYAVKLVITSAQGCMDSVTKNIPVYTLPVANFTATNECVGDSIVITNSSTNATTYNWAYGDGNTGTSSAPVHKHKYAAANSYVIQLIASSGNGCTDTISQTIFAHPIPTADFNFTNVCDGIALPMNDLSIVGTGNIAQWDWNYGDGSANGNTQNTTHTYANCGPYNVTLTVTSDSGCTDVITKQVEVYPNPVPAFTPTEVCLGTPTQFSDLTTVSCNGTPGTLINWVWNFGDGSPTQGSQNPTHTYTTPGVFNTQLVVTTGKGCVDSATVPVTVFDNPDVNFTSDINDGCTPVCVNFINNSNNPVGVTTYTWDFGNGNGTIANNPTHCYENNSLSAKTFDVTVMGITDYGTKQCTTIVTNVGMISVYPLPIADFTWNPEKLNVFYQPEAQFSDLSQGPAVWNWNFGDGGTANTQNPSHTYGDSGTYVIWLNIENQYGCKDSTWKTIRVEPDYALYIPNAFSPDGDGKNDFFFPVGYGVEEQSMLIFDRWGEVVFEGYQLDSKWDGAIKGRDVGKTDVYTYKIETKDVKGESHTYIGKVTLLK